jgi:hypothetical protein
MGTKRSEESGAMGGVLVIDPARCKAEVWAGTKWFRGRRRAVFRQCGHPRGHGEGGEYCEHHTGGRGRYGTVHPPPNERFPGQPEDVTLCIESLDGGIRRAADGNFYYVYRQCPNKRGHGEGGNYCRRHAAAMEEREAEIARSHEHAREWAAMAERAAATHEDRDDEWDSEPSVEAPVEVRASEQPTTTEAEVEAAAGLAEGSERWRREQERIEDECDVLLESVESDGAGDPS